MQIGNYLQKIIKSFKLVRLAWIR